MAGRVMGSLADNLTLAEKLLPNHMRRLAESASSDLVRNVRKHTPVKTGELRESIEEIPVKRIAPGWWRAGAKSELEYASYVEDGTRPHQITPNPPTRALRFFWKGQWRFYKKVQHPGTQPVRMFQIGAIRTRKSVKGIMRRVLLNWKVDSGL